MAETHYGEWSQSGSNTSAFMPCDFISSFHGGIGKGKGGDADAKVRAVVFPLQAVEQSVLRFVLVPPSQGYSSPCGRTAMETLVRIGACRLLLSMNTLQVAVFNLQFEMWVKWFPMKWFPADVTFTGSLCPSVLRESSLMRSAALR